MELPYEVTTDQTIERPRIDVSNKDLIKAFCALTDAGEHEAAGRILPIRIKSLMMSFVALSYTVASNGVSLLDLFNKMLDEHEEEAA